MNSAKRLLISHAVVLGWCCVVVHAGNGFHFQKWYPQWRVSLQQTLNDSCSKELGDYLKGTSTYCAQVPYAWGCVTGTVIDCLLGSVPESWKADRTIISVASGSLLLGLLPTTLTLVGSSTLETGVISLRRPILAILLGAASPSVSPTHTIDYSAGPEDLLCRGSSGTFMIPKQNRRVVSVAVSALQYLLAGAALANVVHAAWELGIKAPCTFRPQLDYLPLLWLFFALVIHGMGIVAVLLRLKLSLIEESGPRSLVQRICLDFELNSNQPRATIRCREERKYFLFLSWVVSICVMANMVFGTLVLSSVLFVGTFDALGIVVRFMASTVVCRLIAMFEISGMRGTAQFSPQSSRNNDMDENHIS